MSRASSALTPKDPLAAAADADHRTARRLRAWRPHGSVDRVMVAGVAHRVGGAPQRAHHRERLTHPRDGTPGVS